MKFNWPAPNNSGPGSSYIAQLDRSWSHAGGTITMQVSRFTGSEVYRVVADADGPVHSAILETSLACTLGRSDLQDGHVIYRAYDLDNNGHEIGGGAIGGPIDDLHPRSYIHYHDAQTALSLAYVAGGNSFLEYGGVTNLYSWTDGALIRSIIPTGNDVGQPQTHYVYQGDSLFWMSGAATFHVIKVDAGAGPKDFVSFGSDWTHGADDFGTDGTALVWSEASGRSDPNQPFNTVSIMTAPYTTDPTQIQKRRLRSELPLGFGLAETVVGCGYAVHRLQTSSVTGVRVIRLSDGWSWPIMTPTPKTWGYWQGPIALTCTEFFASVWSNGQNNVFRVRLDSLGPGDPPD